MTSRNMVRAAFALAGILSLAVGTTTVAQADSFRHHDATGDVIVTRHPGGGTTHTVEPNQRRPDFENLTVLHTRWIASIATSLRGFDGIDDNWSATILASNGDRFVVYRAVSTGSGDGFTPFFGLTRNGYRLKCEGLYVSRTSSGVIAKVPSRCLGDPWKVRVGVLADTVYDEYNDIYGDDDVLRNGGFTDRKPALGPWIAR